MRGLSLSLDQAEHYIFPGWLVNIGIDQKKLSYLASLHEFGIKLISANPKKKYQYIPDSTVLYHICFGFNYQTVNKKQVKKLDTTATNDLLGPIQGFGISFGVGFN